MKRYILAGLILGLIVGALTGCGSLGGFDTVTFSTTKHNLEIGLDSLFAGHPEYSIPSKWKDLDDWDHRGYGFLEARIFYFKDAPEEMYYVSFIGDPADTSSLTASLSIRAVSLGESGWFLEKTFKSKERKRIEARFENEIVPKLEQYTNSTVTVDR